MKDFTERTLIWVGFTATSWILSIFLIAGLALPFSWLWNEALVPSVRVARIGYGRSLELLLLGYIVDAAVQGVTISAKFRKLPLAPVSRPYRPTGPRL